MKKFLCVAIAFVCTTALQAQETEKDVTKFLGIPVDGYKPAMIEKLKAKGFRSMPNTDILEGEFNGTEVDMLTKKSVWFMISERAGKYYICMYYDNEYNKANGEDL